MGNLISRLNNQLNNNAVEETETMNNYKYPPKSGKKREFSLFSLFYLFFCKSQEISFLLHLSWVESDSIRLFLNLIFSAKTPI
jgi:hypothetical protein